MHCVICFIMPGIDEKIVYCENMPNDLFSGLNNPGSKVAQHPVFTPKLHGLNNRLTAFFRGLHSFQWDVKERMLFRYFSTKIVHVITIKTSTWHSFETNLVLQLRWRTFPFPSYQSSAILWWNSMDEEKEIYFLVRHTGRYTNILPSILDHVIKIRQIIQKS